MVNLESIPWVAIDEYLALFENAKDSENLFFNNSSEIKENNGVKISAKEYEKYFNDLLSFNNQYINWLNSQAGYQSARAKIIKKDIFYPLDYELKNISPIQMDFFLCKIIAASLKFYKEIKDSNGKNLILNKKNIDLLKKRSRSLLDLINSDPFIKSKVQRLLPHYLEGLSNGIGVFERSIGEVDAVFAIEKMHPKIFREIFIRYLAREYAKYFGQFKKTPRSAHDPEKPVKYFITRIFLNNKKTVKTKNETYKIIKHQHEYIAHPDVISDIVSIIDPDISERKVAKIISKLRKLLKKEVLANRLFRAL